MLPYRIISWITEVYPFAVFAFYIGLAALTFSVTFVMPPVAILLLLSSIFILVPAVGLFRILKLAETRLARMLVRRHLCPSCGDDLHGAEQADCLICGIAWDPEGTKIGAPPSRRAVPATRAGLG